jgi:hypothetical protein
LSIPSYIVVNWEIKTCHQWNKRLFEIPWLYSCQTHRVIDRDNLLFWTYLDIITMIWIEFGAQNCVLNLHVYIIWIVDRFLEILTCPDFSLFLFLIYSFLYVLMKGFAMYIESCWENSFNDDNITTLSNSSS